MGLCLQVCDYESLARSNQDKRENESQSQEIFVLGIVTTH